MSEFHFSGKVVAVTSASSPLGQALVSELIDKGATVFAQVAVLMSLPCKQFFSMSSFADQLASLNKVDVLINLLPVQKSQSFEDSSYAEIAEIVGSAFFTSRAVWKMMRKHKHGNILNIVPAEFFYTPESPAMNQNPEQKLNPVALPVATLAWQGLVNTLKREGAKFNIRTNTLIYKTNPQNFTDFNDCIIPVVLFMTHISFKDSGSVIEVDSQKVSRVRIERGSGKLFPNNFKAEDVRECLSEISDIGQFADYPVAYSESLLKGFFMNVLRKPRL